MKPIDWSVNHRKRSGSPPRPSCFRGAPSGLYPLVAVLPLALSNGEVILIIVLAAIPIGALSFALGGQRLSADRQGASSRSSSSTTCRRACATRTPRARRRSATPSCASCWRRRRTARRARGEEPLDVERELERIHERGCPPGGAGRRPAASRGGAPAGRRAQRAPRPKGRGAPRGRGRGRAAASRAREPGPVARRRGRRGGKVPGGGSRLRHLRPPRRDRGRAAAPGHLLQPADRGGGGRRRLGLDRPGGLQHGGLRGSRLGPHLRRGADRRGGPRRGAPARSRPTITRAPSARCRRPRSSRATTSSTPTRTARTPGARTERDAPSAGGRRDR